MKATLQDGRRYILRFDKDEEIMAGLVQFAKEANLQGAHFSGIGTATTLELGFFNAFLKDYRHKQFIDNVEILSLSGTIALLNGEPVVHAHGSFGTSDFGVIGGHIFKLVTLATCEIFLIALDQPLNRVNNPDFNLNLFA